MKGYPEVETGVNSIQLLSKVAPRPELGNVGAVLVIANADCDIEPARVIKGGFSPGTSEGGIRGSRNPGSSLRVPGQKGAGGRGARLHQTVGNILPLAWKGINLTKIRDYRDAVWSNEAEILSLAIDLKVGVKLSARVSPVLSGGEHDKELTWFQLERRERPFC